MYVDLLSRALAIADDADCRRAVEDFADATDRLHLCQSDPYVGVEEVVAVEVEYDRALLRLARFFGLDASPERFTSPGSERQRLEGALAERSPLVHTLLARR